MDARFGFLILGEGAVLGIVLAAMGLVRVIREAGALKARVEAYGKLPINSDFILVSRRLAIGERALDSTVFLQARYAAAIRELRTAGITLAASATDVVRAARAKYRL